MPEHPTTMNIRSRADLLGLVPYLLGFHPVDSMVAIFLGPDRRIRVSSRVDLCTPPIAITRELTSIAGRHDIASVMLIGYGPRTHAHRVTTVADILAVQLPVSDTLLVYRDTYFCLRCACAATNGVPFDPMASVSAAELTLKGRVALPSRADLLALTEADPIQQAAVDAAICRLRSPDDAESVLRRLMRQAADGRRLSTYQIAQLAVLLRATPVRDAAWRATSTLMWQRDLWLDVTRRVPDTMVAAPASLAAWCAWLRGEEPLAGAAAHRALRADPTYTMARLIDRAVHAHVPASDVLTDWPPTENTNTTEVRP